MSNVSCFPKFMPRPFPAPSPSPSPSPPPTYLPSGDRSPSPSASPPPLPPWHGSNLDPTTKHVAHIIHQAYHISDDEVGCTTRGHHASQSDYELAGKLDSNLLYGELLPHGVTRMCDQQHLNAHDTRVKQVYDLGSGCGKLIMQIFLQFPHIKHCVGVELATSRLNQAIEATVELAEIRQKQGSAVTIHRDSDAVELIETMKSSQLARHLTYRFQSLFEAVDAWDADILVVEVKFDNKMYGPLCRFLSRCKVGCRLLTYENMDSLHAFSGVPSLWKQLPINMDTNDRFFTSWALRLGHHFYIYEKIYPNGLVQDEKTQEIKVN